MADLSYLSDTDDSAVEELISQAQDLCVLEQVAAINCSAFTDSLLPADLESRFRKLKSFPAATNNATAPSTGSARRRSTGDEDAAIFSPSKHNPDEKIKMGSTPKSTSGSGSPPLEFSPKRGTKGSKKAKSNNFSVSSRSNSSNSSPESAIFSPAKHKRPSKLKSLSRSLSSPFGSCNSLMGSPSPPRKPGCFWCSPKTKSKSIGPNLKFGNDDELLSDLRSFSKKEQTRKLKKALKEEEKICKEAEKVVQWAKQASARMSVIGIEDDLSDD